jgi:hypothetical protein
MLELELQGQLLRQRQRRQEITRRINSLNSSGKHEA